MAVSLRAFALAGASLLHLAGAAWAQHWVTAENEPWRDRNRALVLDAYEYNEIDLTEIATDKRIAGFIGKASDGLPPPYRCEGSEAELKLCGVTWRRYAMSKELHHTRKALAKALGLKWGAYHLARPGNPLEQADHFIDFAEPEADDLMAIDIEDNDPEKWMSLEDAETFVRRIRQRTGRYPVLYTNGSTAKHIADRRDKYPLLSRLHLWYARYKPNITDHFPKGNWESYALWQFASKHNCGPRNCPYRVRGANRDIDVNVADMTVAELKAVWPMDDLVPEIAGPVLLAEVPVPASRHPDGLHPEDVDLVAVSSIAPLGETRTFSQAFVSHRIEAYTAFAEGYLAKAAGAFASSRRSPMPATSAATAEKPAKPITQDDIAEEMGL